MRITPVQIYRNTNFSIKNEQPLNKQQMAKNVYFKGANYPSGYYTDEEIGYAKKYLNKDGWEKDLYDDYHFGLMSSMGTFEFCFTSKPEDRANEMVRRVRALMVDLNNETLDDIKKQKNQIQQDIDFEVLSSEIKKRLLCKFIDKIQDNKNNPNIPVPTAILLTGSTKRQREGIMEWLKTQTNTRNVSFPLPTDEDDALYRIETEIEYAKEHYDDSHQRTVLYIDDFERILNNKETSNQVIGDMKSIMFGLSENNTPVTIIFSVDDTCDIDEAFLQNSRRIPLKLDFDNLPSEQEPEPKNGLDVLIEMISDCLKKNNLDDYSIYIL